MINLESQVGLAETKGSRMEFTKIEQWYLNRLRSKIRLSWWSLTIGLAVPILALWLKNHLGAFWALWAVFFIFVVLSTLKQALADQIIFKLLEQIKVSEPTRKFDSK